eukprot:2888601-Rhodomonas_salina.1
MSLHSPAPGITCWMWWSSTLASNKGVVAVASRSTRASSRCRLCQCRTSRRAYATSVPGIA